jgi:hypothetical protein
VQGVVDHRVSRLLQPRADRRRQWLTGELGSEVDDRGHTTAGRRTRAGEPVVPGLEAAGVERDVGVPVDDSWQHDASGGVQDGGRLGCRQVRTDGLNALAAREQVGADLPLWGHQAAVLNEQRCR